MFRKQVGIIPLIALTLFLVPGQKMIAQEPISIQPTEVISLYGNVPGKVPVITCIDIDPSGKFLAMGGDDHLVRLWDVGSKKIVFSKRDQLEWVRGIAFGDDKNYLVAAGQDGQLEVYRFRTGDFVRKIDGKNRGIQAIAFRPGGKEFALCGFDSAVPVYNIESGKIVRTLKAHGTSNRAIRFSPDGSLLAVAGRTGFIRIWEVDSGKILYELSGDGRRVNALEFNPDGSQLAVGGEGPNITIWNMKNGKRLTTLPERTGKTYSLAFCGEGILASGESDNTIRFWNLGTKTYYANTATPEGHSGTIATLVYDPQTGMLASGSFDTTVRFWAVPK